MEELMVNKTRLPKVEMVNEYRKKDGVCLIMYHAVTEGKIDPNPFRVTLKDGSDRIIYDYPKLQIDVITKTEALDSGYVIGDRILDWEIVIDNDSFSDFQVNYLWLKSEGKKWAVTKKGDIRKVFNGLQR